MKNILSYISIIISLGLGIIFLYSKEKIVYIDSTRVFEDFAMTKESFKEFNRFFETKKHFLDSLENNFKNFEIDLKSKAKISQEEEKRYILLQQDLNAKKSQLEEETKIMYDGNKSKIWERINEYTALYGKESKIQIILGANGDGNIMYAEETKDMTKELTNYINEKYSGKAHH